MYEVFCDIDSEKRFVWTLIESFSLRNNNEFWDKAFYKNYPINQKEFTWSKFRLSRALMMATANNSTHVRATCNFDSEKRNYRDYLRAKLSELDVMHFDSIECTKFEFVSVRGYNCSNCTALFGQSDKMHAHTDSYWGSEQRYKCQFTGALVGAVKRPGGEDNFGHYETVNLNHTCTLSDDSTTQWWFGVHE